MVWVVSPNVVWVDSPDEIQLYDTDAGEFQTLNSTGAAIWRHLVRVGEQDAIVAGLAEEFGAEDDNQRGLIADDTSRFLRHLADQGIIRPRSTDRPAAPATGDPTTER
ncbi:PqqD family protein [Micromonospora sp. NPDC000207]|uniref:PqqD family protein n=1 Tax=Micromonospora sp. NPDC000207 TaxID=3154246 RepID=UPI0033309EDF